MEFFADFQKVLKFINLDRQDDMTTTENITHSAFLHMFTQHYRFNHAVKRLIDNADKYILLHNDDYMLIYLNMIYK